MKKQPEHNLLIEFLGLFVVLLMVLIGFSFVESSQAADDLNLELTGTLIEPPACTINGGNTIYISFGDKVSIKKVPDGIYRQPVELDIECEESNQAWSMTLSYMGNKAAFDPMLSTVTSDQQADFGVQLLMDDVPMMMNARWPVNAENLPRLEAVLVQKAGAELKEGPFTARAILRLEYE
ncbi:fimbrial protein [Siccibacter turicensis]|uniref:fimbrial protein n=1 Tax=Siccibacter turicensis TaxID=357233 RepID=UPI000463F378|nr:fimbrial protein [Siccibacter turicensis]